MLISTKTTVGFKVPDEYEQMTKFKAQHPDWKESETSSMIFFEKNEVYSMDMRGGEG